MSVTLIPGMSRRAFTTTLIPRRVKLRSSVEAASRSSSGMIPGRYSSSVTATPRSWNSEANSDPTAPAPTITIDLGRSALVVTSSEVMT